MAVKEMTPAEVKYNVITEFAFETADSATDGFEFAMKNSDEYVNVIVYNSDESTEYDITIKAPTNGGYFASSADETHELAPGEYAQIKIESARFANNKGIVKLIPKNVAVKVAALY